MLGDLSNFLSTKAKRKLSVLSTAASITVQPSIFARQLDLSTGDDLRRAFKFFLACVAIIIAIETAFSFAFGTAFSDLVHNFFPVFVALLGVVTIYVFLKLLLTPDVLFQSVATGTLYVGGTALLVLISSIFVLLTFDFATNYQSVMTSSCKNRTIMCLLSGGSQSDYGVLQKGNTTETQGWSFSYVLLLILGVAVYYSHILSSMLKCMAGVARWRTYTSAFLSFVVTAPASLVLINVIYKLIYS